MKEGDEDKVVNVTGKRSLTQLWRIKVMWLAIGLGLALMCPGDCLGVVSVRGIFQEVRRSEIAEGDLSETIENVEGEDKSEDTDWEEEFTDTDSRRGILAVRGEVFQGFGGQVQLVVKEMEGGRETVISLHKEGGYIANQELRLGRYQVVSVEADSDGRKFDCHVEAEELVVDTDRVTMCRFFVNPGSVYQVTYETEGEIQGMENRDKEVGTEPDLELAEGQVNKQGEIESDLTEESSGLEEQSGIPITFMAAVFGTVISLYGAVWMIRKHRN